MNRQMVEFLNNTVIPLEKFHTQRVKIGVLGDTQLGSKCDDIGLVKTAYNIFESEGIRRVYHTGDLVDGEKMYRGHEYELLVHGADEQVKYVCKHYPYKPHIITHFITGNHDLSFWKNAGCDIGYQIAQKREDLVYEGQEEKDIDIQDSRGHKIRLRLSHPGGGTAYALSYHPQKYTEIITGGEKPNIILIGHYHKAEWIPNYRNVAVFQTATLQHQTGFMRRQKIAAMMGFWILEFGMDRKGLVRLKAEFIPFY
ncbi:MAG: hypothetical protein PHT40_02860 [Patescibacteria group bacterium]|nr:hypothetical protein [Patescibacteria group bacterium]